MKHKRLSIPVAPETEAAFEKFAAVTGVSVSKAMGEWLNDTVEGVDAMTRMIAGAKGNSMAAARNMSLYAEGLVDQGTAVLTELLERAKVEKAAAEAHMAKRERSEARRGATPPLERPAPPVSNTGGKVPQNKGSRKRGTHENNH